jgi:hypothetical protein
VVNKWLKQSHNKVLTNGLNKNGELKAVNLVLKLVNVIFLLRLLSLLAAVSMQLQPELNEKARQTVSEDMMVVDFDIDGDGKITPEEVAMKERMLEIELREEKAESQKFMAWVAMGMMIIFTIFLFTPLMSDTRVSALADLLGLFYIAQTGVVAAYMGATAYMAGKPMGNKVAMKKDMR